MRSRVTGVSGQGQSTRQSVFQNLPGADIIRYEAASAATEGAGLETGDQGQDGLHGLPGRQDQKRDGHFGQIDWQVCSSGF